MSPRHSVPLALLLLLAFFGGAGAQSPPAPPERPFVPIAQEDILNLRLNLDEVDSADRAYLGVQGGSKVGLTQIPAEVVLVEFMNVHCPACKLQAPILNEAHDIIRRRGDLKDKVRFLSVSAGNNLAETQKFRKEQKISFPVLPDPLFAVYDAVGSSEGLPFLLLVTLHPDGGAQPVAMGHLGMVSQAAKIVSEIEAARKAKAPDQAARLNAYKLGEWRNLKLNASESYVRKLLGDSAGEIGMRSVSIEQVEPAKNDTVYRITSGNRRVWAKVAGRVKICNACENIFFIILFDDLGRVVNFTPIKVTKGYNLRWDENDIAFMKKRLIGLSVLEQRVFNPAVDSVTSATMSVDLIFDTVRRLGGSYRALKAKGLI